MIVRFMFFYKPGVTEWYQSHIDCRTKPIYNWSSFKSSSLYSLPAETILLLYSLNSMAFTRLALISLYRIVFVDFGLNQSSDHHEYKLGDPFIIIR